jgi:hypothetical protein
MTEVDQRVTLAAEYLAEARQRSVEQLPPTLLMRECAELRRQLGAVLDAYGDRAAAAAALLGRHDAERVTRLTAAMTADPALTPPGEPAWTAEDVIAAAAARGLAAMEAQYLTGGEQ